MAVVATLSDGTYDEMLHGHVLPMPHPARAFRVFSLKKSPRNGAGLDTCYCVEVHHFFS